MSSLYVTVDESTDTTLPIIPNHPILPAAGALALFDCRELPAGVPAHGDRLINLAEDQAIALGVSPVLTWQMDDAANDGVHAKIERTGKGALHGIFSQASPVASGIGAGVVLDKTVTDYMVANPTHTYSLTVWHRLTRAEGAGQPNFVFSGVFFYSGASFGIPFVAYSPANVPGQRLSDVRFGPVYSGTTAAMFANDNRRHLLSFGRRHASNLTNTAPPSHMGYLAMLEDHTVSGRTIPALQALSAALVTDTFAAGGDFAADTFTDPTTIA